MSKQKASERLGRLFERSMEREEFAPPWPVFFKVPTARTRRGRERKKTWLDYVAVRPVDGRTVTFDAKWVGEEQRVTKSLLTPFQQECCEAALASGAIAFVLVGQLDGAEVKRHVVPWKQLLEGGVDLGEHNAAPEGQWWVLLEHDALHVDGPVVFDVEGCEGFAILADGEEVAHVTLDQASVCVSSPRGVTVVCDRTLEGVA